MNPYSIQVSIDDLSTTDACVNWKLPSSVYLEDVLNIQLKLWHDGTFKNQQELN